MILTCGLNISKGTSCQKTQFWVMEVAKSKYLKIWSHDQNLLSKLLERFDAKTECTECLCKNWLLNYYYYCIPILCPDSKTLKSFFSQNQLFTNLLWHYQWNYHIMWTQYPIWKLFCTKSELKEKPFRKYQKVNLDIELLTQLVHFDMFSHIKMLILWCRSLVCTKQL